MDLAYGTRRPYKRQITYYYDDATVITVLLSHKNNGVALRYTQVCGACMCNVNIEAFENRALFYSSLNSKNNKY